MTPAKYNPYRSPDGQLTRQHRFFYTKLFAVWLFFTAVCHLLAWAILTASGLNFQIDELIPNHASGNILARQQTLHLCILPIAATVGTIAAWLWKREYDSRTQQ